jgi:Uma2 family endonuclease
MSQTAKRYDEVYEAFLNLPENIVGEILGGELHTQPRPAPKHALAASYLGDDLIGPYGKGRGGPGGWWILDEPEIHLNDDILVPDMAGWKKERMPRLPETAFFSLPPDWVCEVLSQQTARKDRIKKMPLYATYGVPYIWLIDPVLKTLETYRLGERHWELTGTFAENDHVSAQPFQETSIDLSFLWEADQTECD